MRASQDGHTAIVQVLLEAGADKDATNRVREYTSERRSHTYAVERGARANRTQHGLLPTSWLRIHVRCGGVGTSLHLILFITVMRRQRVSNPRGMFVLISCIAPISIFKKCGSKLGASIEKLFL